MADQRISVLEGQDWDPSVREILEKRSVEGAPLGELNLFRTLAHHPALLKRYLAFGGQFLRFGLLEARDRELLILRTASNCRCAYEWAQHVRIGLDLGMSRKEIDRVAAGPDGYGWSEYERTLLLTADELHHQGAVADDTWEALAKRYDEAELIEIVMLVGQYRLLAGLINSLKIEVDPGVAEFAALGEGDMTSGPGRP